MAIESALPSPLEGIPKYPLAEFRAVFTSSTNAELSRVFSKKQSSSHRTLNGCILTASRWMGDSERQYGITWQSCVIGKCKGYYPVQNTGTF